MIVAETSETMRLGTEPMRPMEATMTLGGGLEVGW